MLSISKLWTIMVNHESSYTVFENHQKRSHYTIWQLLWVRSCKLYKWSLFMIALALKSMLLKIETFLSQFQTLWLLAFLFWHLVQFSFFGGRRHLSLFSPSLSISAAVVGPIKVLLIEKKVEKEGKNLWSLTSTSNEKTPSWLSLELRSFCQISNGSSRSLFL